MAQFQQTAMLVKAAVSGKIIAHMRATIRWADVARLTAHRATGGRRRYNAQRRRTAKARRQQVARLLAINPHTSGAEIARRVGVHRATISRDIGGIAAWLARFNLGFIDDLPGWWELYVKRVACGNVFSDIFGRLGRIERNKRNS